MLSNSERRQPDHQRRRIVQQGAVALHGVLSADYTALSHDNQSHPASLASILSRMDGATRAHTVSRLQQQHGNAYVQRLLSAPEMVQRQPQPPAIAPAASPAVKVSSYTLSFQLPKGATVSSGWNDVYTEDYTDVRVTLSKDGLKIKFVPPLIADLQWPATDYAIIGGSRNAQTGDIIPNFRATQDVAVEAGWYTVYQKFHQWIRDIVTGTPLGITPYDYDADPSPLDTLQQIVGNMKDSGGGGGSSIQDKDIKSIKLTTKLKFATPLVKQTSIGGVRISGEATAIITFSGTAETVADASKRTIRSIELEGSDIVMLRDGKDVAKVGRVVLSHGGDISVSRLEVLHPVAGIESLIRLFGMLSLDPLSSAALQAGIVTQDMIAGLDASAIKQLVKEEIDAALGPAIRDAIRANCHAIPDVNLCQMLGL